MLDAAQRSAQLTGPLSIWATHWWRPTKRRCRPCWANRQMRSTGAARAF